ncbi:hypothetical protein [Calothrix sp. NIES-3974]|nr:hypothetical protein [Calothrix sp. NIES-3974]
MFENYEYPIPHHLLSASHQSLVSRQIFLYWQVDLITQHICR